MENKLETKYKTADESPGFLFWKIANLHQRFQRNALKELAVSPTQFSILACYFFLKREDSLPAQSDICEMAGLDKMLVSDTTKALLKKKLIKKRVNKIDRRSFQIELTDHGKEVCNKAVKIIEDVDTWFFALSGNSKEMYKMLKHIEQKATRQTKSETCIEK